MRGVTTACRPEGWAEKGEHRSQSRIAARCRSCGEAELVGVLSLGETPLANSLLTRERLDEPEAIYPLQLAFCPHCALGQILPLCGKSWRMPLITSPGGIGWTQARFRNRVR